MAWTGWDDLHVVYHRPSGKTHIVNEATVRLLQDVLVAPLALEEAASKLADDQGLIPDDQLTAHLRDVILHLEELGLVLRS